jgi:hypothetical protein
MHCLSDRVCAFGNLCGTKFSIEDEAKSGIPKEKNSQLFCPEEEEDLNAIIIHVSIQTWKISYNVVFFVFKLDWDCTVLRATNNNSLEDDMISSLGRDREKGSLKVSTQA